MMLVGLYFCSRFFQKICQQRGKAGGVSVTLLNAVKSHVATANNTVIMSCCYTD